MTGSRKLLMAGDVVRRSLTSRWTVGATPTETGPIFPRCPTPRCPQMTQLLLLTRPTRVAASTVTLTNDTLQ